MKHISPFFKPVYICTSRRSSSGLKLRTQLLVTVALALLTQQVLASGMYSELDATVNRIRVNDIEYKPYASKLKLGYEINQYAIEFQYSGGTSDDQVNQEKLLLESQMGLYFRVNYDINYRSVIYLNFGAARSTLVTTVGTTETSKEYDDYSYSFGVEDYFPGVKFLNLTLEYTELYKDKDIKIEALSLGVRYTF